MLFVKFFEHSFKHQPANFFLNIFLGCVQASNHVPSFVATLETLVSYFYLVCLRIKHYCFVPLLYFISSTILSLSIFFFKF